jgi:polar amino acid transport system substrate-binding protein
VAFDLGRALAARLGVEYEVVVHGSNPEALAAVAEGRADFAFTNATPERARVMDLARPVLIVHKSLLVPNGSRLTALASVSQQPARVGALEGSTTAVEFSKLYPLATMVPMSSLPVALRALRAGEIDALAANNAILYELGDQLPGSKVLAGSWGSERFGIGVPKGRSTAHAFLQEFSESISRDGTLSAAVVRAGLRGVDRP